jgi:hypothetical protein
MRDLRGCLAAAHPEVGADDDHHLHGADHDGMIMSGRDLGRQNRMGFGTMEAHPSEEATVG